LKTEHRENLVWVTCALACLVALVPIWSVTFPPLQDYPAHLARMHILADLKQSPTLQGIYQIDWALLPNLAMDIVVPFLSKMMPLNAAGKVFLSAIVLMWIVGPLLLHRALFGRVGFWPLLAGFFAYNWCLAIGLLNFVFGAGLSFFLLAAWAYCKDWPPVRRWLLFTVLATVLFFCHLVALGIYALAILGFEAGRTIQHGEFARPKQLLSRWSVVFGQFAAPAIIFLFFSPTSERVAYSDNFAWGSIKDRLNAVRSPVLFEWGPIDYATLGVAAAILIYALAKRSLRVHPAFLWAIILLLLTAAVMPAGLEGASLRHIRVPPVLAAIVFAGTSWIGKPGQKTGAVIFALCAALFVARTAITTERWQRHDDRLIEFRQALADIDEGSSLFSVLSGERPTDNWRTNPDAVFPYLHMTGYAVITNSSFTPGVFANPGEQPIRSTAAYAALHEGLGVFTTWDELLESLRGGVVTVRGLSGWPRNFDYLVVINLDQRKLVPPDFLTTFRVGSYFTIFKIKRTAVGS
jgi:hypothetical protein